MTRKFRTVISVGVVILLAAGLVGFELWSQFGSPSSGETNKPSQPDEQAAKGANYTADLSAAVPVGFTNCTMRTTKLKDRKYIAQIMGSAVRFTLDDLPKHTFVHVVFDLVLFNSWNGCNHHWGPDIWMCDVEGGPQLERTSFSNCGMFSGNNEQNYPDEFPLPADEEPYPAWTGVVEHATLGDMHSWGKDPVETFDCSAIYRMDWTFPHSDPKLKLKFSTKTTNVNKVYGFLSFHVETLPAGVPMTQEQFKKGYGAIRASDPIAANAAVWQMIAAGDAAVEMLKGEDLSKLNDSPLTRVLHVLRVVNSAAAKELAGKMPTTAAGGGYSTVPVAEINFSTKNTKGTKKNQDEPRASVLCISS